MPEVIFGLIAVLTTALFVREYTLRKKQTPSHSSDEVNQKSHPGEQKQTEDSPGLEKSLSDIKDLVQRAETDSEKLINESKTVLTESVTSTSEKLSQIVEETKTAEEKSLQNAQADFNQFLSQLTKLTENQSTAGIQNFTKYLEDLKKQTEKAQLIAWEGAQQRVNSLFENFENKLAEFLVSTEQKMMLSVDLELRSARQLIDTYKVQQMNMIDENIVAMLEKTLSMVLAKNLDLKNQMELVYDSLERAKAESFLS